MQFAAKELDISIWGLTVISLRRPHSEYKETPQILSAQILPGRGMNIYQLKVYVPGQGVIDMFESPSLEEARSRMNGGPEDVNGNQSFTGGGAILVPYANRIRGTLLPDGGTLETTVNGE